MNILHSCVLCFFSPLFPPRCSSSQTYFMFTSIKGEVHFPPNESHTSLVKIFLYSKKNPSKMSKSPFVLKKSFALCCISASFYFIFFTHGRPSVED